jgi:6,7-dimethyl-8-ribityllumazine synthase
VKILRGRPDGVGRRVAVVAGRYNEVVTSKLVEGALAGLTHHGVSPDDITVAWVPGAFEIPLVASRYAADGRYGAVIALGAVIRGETTHFDLVANEAARGIADVSRATGVPVIFEVLATDDLEQAQSRAGGAHGNKGWEAAEAALEMASLLEGIGLEETGKGEAG